jgi:hypothetical protein
LWEWNKGYPTKVLDRYYIYTQYVPFLSFMAAGSHIHTEKYVNNDNIFDYEIISGEKIPLHATKLRIPNYSLSLEIAGFFGGEFDTEDYKYFTGEYGIPKPDTTINDNRLNYLAHYSGFVNDRQNYINNYYGAKTQIVQNFGFEYYIERYKDFKYSSLPTTKEDGIYSSFSVDDYGNVETKILPKYSQPYEFQLNFDKKNLLYINIDKNRYITVFSKLKRLDYAQHWFVDGAYSIKMGVFREERTLDVQVLVAVYQQFLKFGNSFDFQNFITFSADQKEKHLYIHNEGSEFEIKELSKTFQAFSFIRTFSIDSFTKYAFPFPELDNSLEWSKVATIAFKTEPTTTPTPPPTKKAPKPISEEKQLVKNEITALKQALKYLSGEEAESVKNEIEALKQSLKYI